MLNAIRYSNTPALVSATLVIAIAAASTKAQPFDLSWHTIDGGGAMLSSGGAFTLSATIGQSDAGVPMSGGSFTMSGGFWPGAAEPDATGVTIVSANPPADNPYLPGQQPFRDVLDTGPGNALTAGIGGSGTPAQGGVSYAPISVTFSAPPSPPPAPANVVVSCTGGACPTITSVSGSGAGPYSLALSGPIPPGQCTTLMFAGTAAGSKLQYQSQPGNVSMDALTNTQDLLALIQALNDGSANVPANLARYNLNRSAGTNPVNTQDLLRLIQLLNGINTTESFNGAGVAACP